MCYVSKKCEECGCDKQISIYQVTRKEKTDGKIFCSVSCGAKFYSRIKRNNCISEYNKNPNLCKFCDSPLSFDNKTNQFCDRSCGAKFNNALRKKQKAKLDVARIEYKCLNCDTPLNRKGKYCNHDCQNEMRKRILYEKIESGDITQDGRQYKKYLIDKHGECCMECGWEKRNPITNKVPLELEHIDGNHKNNRLDNLKIICPNCHSLTPTFKALNKGNGRHYRRIRYKQGKSF
jgi:hypothetical protein